MFGNVIHSAPEDMYMAGVVGIKAGIPKETPAFTVNRLCGTGVQAIVSAAQTIQIGEADVVLAGGAKSMSRGPYWMPRARWGARMGESKWLTPPSAASPTRSTRPHGHHSREPRRVSRHLPRGPRRIRLKSHRRAQAAKEADKFHDEVVPVQIKGKREKVRSPATSTCGRRPLRRRWPNSGPPSSRTAP